jgi:putative transposase
MYEHWFLKLADASEMIENRRIDYRTFRSHGSLGGRTPEEFVASRISAYKSK